jgi:hypothetical protein
MPRFNVLLHCPNGRVYNITYLSAVLSREYESQRELRAAVSYLIQRLEDAHFFLQRLKDAGDLLHSASCLLRSYRQNTMLLIAQTVLVSQEADAAIDGLEDDVNSIFTTIQEFTAVASATISDVEAALEDIEALMANANALLGHGPTLTGCVQANIRCIQVIMDDANILKRIVHIRAGTMHTMTSLL